MQYTLYVHSPSLIVLNRVKYELTDYVITGWQADDLPIFSCISTIYVVNHTPFFKVAANRTVGVGRHYHSFLLEACPDEQEESIVCVSSFIDHQTYQTHLVHNGGLYVNVRSHVEKVVSIKKD